MDELKAPGKPFDISKQAVWEAWEKVRANQGAAGVDGQSIEDFEKAGEPERTGGTPPSGRPSPTTWNTRS